MILMNGVWESIADVRDVAKIIKEQYNFELGCVLEELFLREIYINYDINLNVYNKETYPNKKVVWQQMIQLLPSSYNQKRTVMLNYEVLSNMYHSRKNHKLDEWKDFCFFIECLPYSELIIAE